jgi:GNAT superfamily N-acetyltransferase
MSVPGGHRRLDGRFRIRQATLGDLPELARVRSVSVHASQDLAAPGSVDPVPDWERVAAEWAEEAGRGGYFWGVIDSHVPAVQGLVWVGVAHARAASESGAPAALELVALHLLEVAQGSGIADRLLQMAIGDAPAYLWLQGRDPRAAPFLERHGFRPDGVSRARDGQPDGRMEVRLVRD